MLQNFVIVSGANAGRPGPWRATPGCDCPACVEYRTIAAECRRHRYATDLEFAERERAYPRDRYARNPEREREWVRRWREGRRSR